ncbi:MAG: hypothetical protein ACFWTZ_07790 [Burkholderia sp.]|jgi:heptose-I-phosphate ethanolaminephosphotransferase
MKKFTVSRETLAACGIVLLISAVLLLSAAAPRRAAQLLCFLLPGLLLWAAADTKPGLKKPAAALLIVSAALSDIDAGIRGFLRSVYQSDLQSDFIIGSIANTNPGESLQYLETVWPDVLIWTAAALAAFALQCAAVLLRKRAGFTPVARRRLAAAIGAVLAAAAIVSFVNHPWRNQYPVFGWVKSAKKAVAYRAEWLASAQEMEAEEKAAASLITDPGPEGRTIVLVIGESLCRDNMSIYGYERRTTPLLERRLKEDPQFRRIADAWSVKANTITAFESMFDFPVPGDGAVKRGNLFAFFHAAGYRITWISNQDDAAIRGEWSAYADKRIFLNRRGGRSSSSMDEHVLEPLEEALETAAGKQLIVVHLIGLHPHFSLRHPEDLEPLWPEDDAVEKRLEAMDRPVWVQEARDEYDLGVLYQDRILDETIRLSQEAAKRQPVFWMFLSDHGVETGDWESRTGHSPNSPSGYRIPALLWASPSLTGGWAWDKVASRGFRADWLDDLLTAAAGIRWKGDRPQQSLIGERYDWEDPPSKQRFAKSAGQSKP